MTENESEQLYEDLRRKLADYGSAPPDAVWAGIRQQVPARQPRRWKRSALMLLLLCLPVLMLTMGPRLWRQATGLGHSTTISPATSQSQLGGAKPSSANQPAVESPANATANSVVRNESPSSLAASSTTEGGSAPTASTPMASEMPKPALSSRMGLVGHSHSAENRSRLGRNAEPVLATANPRRKRRAALALLLPTRRSAGNTTALGRKAARTQAETTTAEVPDEQLAYRRRTRRTAYERRGEVARSGASGAVATPHASPDGEGTAQQFSNEPISLLTVRPALPAAEAPEVHRVKRPRPHRSRKAQLLKNWSVQVVAGPSLTYRTLGDSARQLERLERPSVGYSGQVTASYALNKQLTLSTGLGYAEFANRLHYQLQKTTAEASRIIDFRDVYRFVNIPLLAQYTLGGNQRWRIGTLGGANLGLLTGTRTTEGSACNCSQTTAPATGTYRNISLVLTAGGFLNYQFAPGQWLTLRPQGQYFLNSLTDPASGRATRHPWSLGVQAGISFDLEPKK
ncbi:outer membrane beta-barrel protein [Hymenobacter fodinae]|uniref:Outer membrane protein beta-barrel domain-containing protein n=1 Tax=Hymenobacter fodinae TaxID=2510796 RepID=A0A4Z0P847_9BACT|nr:outer membrane beta-barrel protein [Hymenobacter fodinae]TGE08471.1 hypothetical protein EU556_12225 [Hymenobacter fodinae]